MVPKLHDEAPSDVYDVLLPSVVEQYYLQQVGRLNEGEIIKKFVDAKDVHNL